MTHSGYIRSIFALVILTMAGIQAFAVCQEDTQDLTLMMYRPSNGVFYEQSDACSFTAVRLGGKTSIAVPGDYDGDKITDMAAYDTENGSWAIRHSSSGKLATHSIETAASKQQMSNTPVQADYDGDGRTDIAVWHAGSGNWSIMFSSNSAIRQFRLGGNGDVPVPADFDGDGRADIAVFRTADSTWSILESSSDKIKGIIYGRTGDVYLAPADYTGDGKADIAIIEKGKWSVRESETGEIVVHVFGTASSIPVPADHDGDGTVDIAVYSEGRWIFQRSSDGGFDGMEFGSEGDMPVSAVRTARIHVN